MKTRLLMIVAVFLVLIPWIGGFEFGMNNEIMIDGITISSVIVMMLTLTFSLVSWFLLSWASKCIKFTGILLGIITGASLVLPFLQVLGLMAGVIVGVVAGLAAFLLQKNITNPTKNHPLIAATVIIASTYFVLILMILSVQSNSIWDTDVGIGEWTGTADMMEEKRFGNVVNDNAGFAFFLVTIPSLLVTGLLIRDKTSKTKLLIFIGIMLIIEGFTTLAYSTFFLFHSTEPPMMRPIEGIERVLFMYRHVFLFSGISGIFVTIAGVILFWRKRK